MTQRNEGVTQHISIMKADISVRSITESKKISGLPVRKSVIVVVIKHCIYKCVLQCPECGVEHDRDVNAELKIWLKRIQELQETGILVAVYEGQRKYVICHTDGCDLKSRNLVYRMGSSHQIFDILPVLKDRVLRRTRNMSEKIKKRTVSPRETGKTIRTTCILY